MSSWGKADAARAAWEVLMQLNTEQTDGNRTTLFEDTTANAFISGQTIGLFNYADGEVQMVLACRLEPKNNWFWR